MNYSLKMHEQKYDLSSYDILLSTCTGLSGAPYARRHWELAEKDASETCLGHRIIAVFEAIPLIGGIAALLERIATFAYDFFSQEALATPHGNEFDCQDDNLISIPYSLIHENEFGSETSSQNSDVSSIHENEQEPEIEPNQILTPPQHEMDKLIKNATKAITEHREASPRDLYVTIEELPFLTNANISPQNNRPLTFQITTSQNQASRPYQEDCWCHHTTAHGTLVGVFDGHGGGDVAQYATTRIMDIFFQFLEENQGSIRNTFHKAIDQIQKEVIENPKWDTQGTTAVISFLDPKTHFIYTATVGDSEANIYRKAVEGEDLKSIPLSCVRAWNHEREATRAANIRFNTCNESTARTAFIQRFTTSPESSKTLRFPLTWGINMSRAIGDQDCNTFLFSDTPDLTIPPAISHKPKITVQKMIPGDILILASDGLKDYVTELEIINILSNVDQEETLAHQLVSKTKQKHDDNVTVLAIQIQ